MALGARLRAILPAWWHGDLGPGGRAVMLAAAPMEAVFRAAVATRGLLYRAGVRSVVAAPVPVISVGNLTVGGTGKTPVAAWVAGQLAAWGVRPAVVVRGYGADEIELHRELNPGVPVITTSRRLEGALRAARDGAGAVVLDDGFQHRALARRLDLVVIAAERWARPRRLLPRGPWREPVAALRRADFVLVTRKSATAEDAAAVLAEARTLAPGAAGGVAYLRPVHLTTLAGPIEIPLDAIAGAAWLVVSAIGEPTLFARQVEMLGGDVESLPFPDHHFFTDQDIRTMTERAAGRGIVVSRKDAVKLRGRMPGATRVLILQQAVVIETGSVALESALRAAVK